MCKQAAALVWCRFMSLSTMVHLCAWRGFVVVWRWIDWLDYDDSVHLKHMQAFEHYFRDLLDPVNVCDGDWLSSIGGHATGYAANCSRWLRRPQSSMWHIGNASRSAFRTTRHAQFDCQSRGELLKIIRKCWDYLSVALWIFLWRFTTNSWFPFCETHIITNISCLTGLAILTKSQFNTRVTPSTISWPLHLTFRWITCNQVTESNQPRLIYRLGPTQPFALATFILR